MMSDLWANFDSFCFASISKPFLWASCVAVLCFMSSRLFLGESRLFSVVAGVSGAPWGLVKGTSGAFISSFPLAMSSVFLLVLGLNLIGLVPYTFSLTSQLSVSLPLAMLMWSCLLVSSVRVSFKQVYSSFIPSFSPMGLTPFLLLVEIVTVCSRPLTLGFRLLINIVSGHLIMSMSLNGALASLCHLSIISCTVLSLSWSLLLLAELGVAFLQGYIFCTLLSLYSNEHAD
uniref:ATP synthase F0 subunit 6 n=1 Tax=Xenostrobus securis TaxID=1289581 RepID=UPI00226CA81B|nr:ATP synthase F0 subunit 6 [Xenostrobus securis]UZG65993.1 ATP synthase F0 subunit 6 [Xenostrobus securis]